jgi:Lrp/AsnC family transcriptional regulator, leucine-responsive regulatory protein
MPSQVTNLTEKIELDATDLRLLDQLQRDATLSNLALAQAVHTSPATCLRRVKRLWDLGVIEKQVAILSDKKMAESLTVIIEVTLDRQGAEHLLDFENRAVAEAAVQQCYRVSPGPDFVLVIQVSGMPAYQNLVETLLTQNANVRNVKSFFSVHRAKFETRVVMGKV